MTVRRGSLQFKIVRLARVPRSHTGRHSKRWRVARLTAIIAGRCLIALAVLFVTSTVAAQIWRAGTQNVRLHNQIADVKQQNQVLQISNNKLATRADRLHDPEYLVPLIHEQLGLTKPHEIFIEVTPGAPGPAAQK